MTITFVAKTCVASLLLGNLGLGAAEKTVVAHDYNDAKTWTINSVDDLKKAGWLPNAIADEDSSFSVKTINNSKTQWLCLWDDSPAGAPMASLPFATLKNGKLIAGLGTAGKQDQGAILTLTCKGKPLLRIVLSNNTKGYIETGNGKLEFFVPEGKTFYCSPSEFTVTWTTEENVKPAKPATATVVFAGKEIVSGKAMMALGAVDGVSLSASWSSGISKGLYLSKLAVIETSKETAERLSKK